MKALYLAVGLSLLLAACSAIDEMEQALQMEPSSPVAKASPSQTPIASPPAGAVTPTAAEGTLSASENDQKLVTGGIFGGSGGFISGKTSNDSVRTPDVSGDSSLNFVNADIHEVAKAVLGDTLGLNYTIAPSVQGNVTIKINSAIPKEALLPALDAAFRLNGITIINKGNVVEIVPSADAIRQGASVSVAGKPIVPGFGVQIVPLHYISSEEMQRVLTPVAPAGSIIPLESSRNVLVLAGTEEERASMLDVIESFDVDWLSNMSFGLFPLKEANARQLSQELWEVLGTRSGPLSKTVRLVAFDRLNSILVIATEPRFLKEVKQWIDRLDVDQTPSGQKIWVYPVQNGRAAELSETLSKLISKSDMVPNAVVKSAVSTAAAAMPLTDANGVPPPSANQASAAQDLENSMNSDRGPRIIADETTNSLIIMGTKAEFSIIEAALKKLDVVPLQVRIEAVIAEVTLTDDLRYGVQYMLSGKGITGILTNADTVSTSPTLPGFSLFYSGSKISAVLDLLRSVTDVKVISSPELMVLNNQTARLQVGDEVPIETQTAVSVATAGAPVVNSITMQDTGVILKVTPRVNASGMVLMDIDQEVSDVAPTTTSTIDSPTIEERKVASSVAISDGETLALGGLIQDSTTKDKAGIPVLEDIPYLGALFSYTTVNKDRTELLILITPRVVRNSNDVRTITDEMRSQMHAVVPLDAKIH